MSNHEAIWAATAVACMVQVVLVYAVDALHWRCYGRTGANILATLALMASLFFSSVVGLAAYATMVRWF